MRAILWGIIGIVLLINNQTDLDQLTGKAPRPQNFLEQEAQQAFDQMKAAAAQEGIDLSIVSGYRSFERQSYIWNRKYQKYQQQGLDPDQIFDKIVAYSTVPGTSRHHWGTDIDIIDASASYTGDVLVPSKYHGDGPFCKMKDWMEQHASNFGFELVYTLNSQRSGFKYEPWHYSFAPLSRKRYQEYLREVDLISFLKQEDVTGIDQISEERLQRYFNEHIKGVNPILK